jgi:hypothetical protein
MVTRLSDRSRLLLNGMPRGHNMILQFVTVVMTDVALLGDLALLDLGNYAFLWLTPFSSLCLRMLYTLKVAFALLFPVKQF